MTATVNAPHRSFTVTIVMAGLIALGLVLGITASSAVATAQELGPDDLPITTVYNDFYPEDRDLSDCLSVLPRPGCGSSARSGWPQLAVFGLIVIGVGAVATRVIVSARRNRISPTTGSDTAAPEQRRDDRSTDETSTT